MPRKKRLILASAALAVLIVGGAALYYVRVSAASQQPDTTTVQSAPAQLGDISISATGAGQLEPARSSQLTFRLSGVVSQIPAAVGDQVEEGQVLARVNDTTAQNALAQAKLNLALLTSPGAVANAELALATAQKTLKTAQYNQWVQQQGNRANSDTIQSAEAKLTLAQAAVGSAQNRYNDTHGDPNEDPAKAAALVQLVSAKQQRDSALRDLNWYQGKPSAIDQALLESNVAVAKAVVDSAQVLVDELKGSSSGTDLLASSSQDLIQLRQAKEAVSSAEDDLGATSLKATFDGTVTALTGSVGESAGGFTVTVADLANPIIDITIDESDLDKVALGNAIEVTFDSLPDELLTGKVSHVDPTLVSVEGVQTIHATGSLSGTSLTKAASLPSGLSASVEVISAQAKGAVLVPIEALHELSAGQYGVFVLENGLPTLHVVQVGLQSAVYAEIKSGVNVGDQVTTGVIKK